MLKFLSICVAEVGDNPLIFMIKLDEAQIVHSQKLELVSVTLMNRALDSSIDKNDPRYIKVQSEHEIWPVGAFQVPKESHEILS
jgi:hypothetical protein